MQSVVFSKGGMLGLVSILVSLIMYIIAPDMMTQWYVSLISLIIYIYFMTTAATSFKNQNEGHVTFGQGLITAWVTSIIGGFISMVFGYILYNFIDPSLIDKANEAAIEMIEKFAGSMPEEEYEKAIEKIENSNNFGLGAMATNFIFMTIIGLIPSLIIAALTRTKENEFV
jgi:uncharacterized membrane protein